MAYFEAKTQVADRRGARDPDRHREDQDPRGDAEAPPGLVPGGSSVIEDHEAIEELLAGYVLREPLGRGRRPRPTACSPITCPCCPAAATTLADVPGGHRPTSRSTRRPSRLPTRCSPASTASSGAVPRRRRPVAALRGRGERRGSSSDSPALAVTQGMRAERHAVARWTTSAADGLAARPAPEARDSATRARSRVDRDLRTRGRGVLPVRQRRPGRRDRARSTACGSLSGSRHDVRRRTSSRATACIVVVLEFDPSRYDRIVISVEPAGSSRRRTRGAAPSGRRPA